MAAAPSKAAAAAGIAKMPAPTIELKHEKASPLTPITRFKGAVARGGSVGGGIAAKHASRMMGCQPAGVGTPSLDGLEIVGGGVHSPEEFIELDSIVPRLYLLARVVMEAEKHE